MAALVAYYLAEAADPTARKEVVENADMVKYFKQAKFRLPGNPAMILVNAKNSGYLDSTRAGQYRLNPVGYNLIVHSLPRPDSTASAPKSRTAHGARLVRRRGSPSSNPNRGYRHYPRMRANRSAPEGRCFSSENSASK